MENKTNWPVMIQRSFQVSIFMDTLFIVTRWRSLDYYWTTQDKWLFPLFGSWRFIRANLLHATCNMRKKNDLQEFAISYELTKTIKKRTERDDDFTVALMDCQVKTLYIRFTRFNRRILLKCTVMVYVCGGEVENFQQRRWWKKIG